MKAVNFASLDPQQQQRGIAGLRNISKLDRTRFEEFLGSGQWLKFLEEVAVPVSRRSGKRVRDGSAPTTRRHLRVGELVRSRDAATEDLVE